MKTAIIEKSTLLIKLLYSGEKNKEKFGGPWATDKFEHVEFNDDGVEYIKVEDNDGLQVVVDLTETGYKVNL